MPNGVWGENSIAKFVKQLLSFSRLMGQCCELVILHGVLEHDCATYCALLDHSDCFSGPIRLASLRVRIVYLFTFLIKVMVHCCQTSVFCYMASKVFKLCASIMPWELLLLLLLPWNIPSVENPSSVLDEIIR